MELIPLTEMAEQLDKLQSDESSGRGISCVKDIIGQLKLDNLDYARRTASMNHDKISNYPEVMMYIRDELFKGESDHPWKILDRLRELDMPE